MRRLVLPLLTLVAIGGCHKQAPPPPQATPAQAAADAAPATQVVTENAGRRAPDVAFEGPDGKPARIADFKGKPVLVNFWATWCAPCKTEMPSLDALAARTAGKLTVLTISQDLQGRAVVDAFWKTAGFKALQPSLDKSNALMLATKEAGLPVTILYDKDGKEVWRVEGPLEWGGDKAKGLLAQAGV